MNREIWTKLRALLAEQNPHDHREAAQKASDLLEAEALSRWIVFHCGDRGAQVCTVALWGTKNVRHWEGTPRDARDVLRFLLVEDADAGLVVSGEPETRDSVVQAWPTAWKSQIVDRLDIRGALPQPFQLRPKLEHRAATNTQQPESVCMVRFWRALQAGKAVVGWADCAEALRGGQRKTLVLSEALEEVSGWACDACEGWGKGEAPLCLVCGASAEIVDVVSHLTRTAQNCVVQRVYSAALWRHGGVGVVLEVL